MTIDEFFKCFNILYLGYTIEYEYNNKQYQIDHINDQWYENYINHFTPIR